MNRSTLLKRHYESAWGGTMSVCSFVRGPIQHLPVDFAVVCLPPSERRTMWTYATIGMSGIDDERPIELHIFSPRQSDEVVELLFATAHFHATGEPLDLGHTVNFGRPWMDDSQCDHGLITLPYLDGPGLENFNTDNYLAKCYWLVPVTPAEVLFKVNWGVERLEELFEKSNFHYANPLRHSVV